MSTSVPTAAATRDGIASPTSPAHRSPGRGDGVAVLVAAGLLVWWAIQAFGDPLTLDVGLAYQGGQVALATGHPERLGTWISTPFLAVVMAGVSKTVTVGTAANLVTVANLGVVVALLAGVWRGLLGALPPWAWRLSLVAMAGFGPMVSSVWWNQLNLLALGLAVAGFALVGRERDVLGAVAISLSLAVKPLVVLLPLALLVKRDTRRAGLLVLLITVGVMLVSQGVLAIWAGDAGALDPLPALRNFSHKALPANIWACQYENFSPSSTLCRLSGGDNWNYIRGVSLAGVGLLALLFADLLRHAAGRAWEWFAVAVALSPMVSPIAWSHYQVLLAPLLVVLFVRFLGERERLSTWGFLLAAYALTMLVWQPYGTLPGKLGELLAGNDRTQQQLIAAAGVAQFAQYVLLFAAALHFTRRPPGAPRPQAA
ncbi:DUF2029 domain-containing protein [Paraconexibacter antarcticus]|uniref:DUF2029 domain-containing protein n=1 Tax=Paraconexibacter antarcticus TaxID=2949664 RepID=A0ABY5DSQ7_9ACTN|nr:glycosyltransferase family 87 protein [Paraconexibacter antarcticus]UTI65060.1 DUF2029 domain-containing protein [Paraconexibacter antarcticus]